MPKKIIFKRLKLEGQPLDRCPKLEGVPLDRCQECEKYAECIEHFKFYQKLKVERKRDKNTSDMLEIMEIFDRMDDEMKVEEESGDSVVSFNKV
jgi:hypothetical protein